MFESGERIGIVLTEDPEGRHTVRARIRSGTDERRRKVAQWMNETKMIRFWHGVLQVSRCEWCFGLVADNLHGYEKLASPRVENEELCAIETETERAIDESSIPELSEKKM
jgi:hypothetical protein